MQMYSHSIKRKSATVFNSEMKQISTLSHFNTRCTEITPRHLKTGNK